jgi:hypothetical protein
MISERRFILIPKSDEYSSNEEDEDYHARRPRANSVRNSTQEPSNTPIKNLPSLETKTPREMLPIRRRPRITSTRASRQEPTNPHEPLIDSLLLPEVDVGERAREVPREIPPQYRRAPSAFAATPKDRDETPKPHGL